MKHDEKDLRTISPTEQKHIVLRGHLRSFHGVIRGESDPLAAMERLHKAKHSAAKKA